MKIECILHRPGGTKVELGGKLYHFEPQDDGRHVADVAVEAHIERFLSIPEAYRILRTPGAEAVAQTVTPAQGDDEPVKTTLEPGQALAGSTSHPAQFEIEGKTYSLEAVVRRAFDDSGLTVEEWNDLDDETRATKIDLVLDGIAEGEVTLEAVEPQMSEEDERAALIEQYKAKFGSAPRGRMSIETLKAKLAE